MKAKGALESHEESQRSIEANPAGKNRIDLNDLLRRAKEQKKQDDRTNYLIFGAVASLILLVFLILNF